MDRDELERLRKTGEECSKRCLYAAQQWIAELYASVPAKDSTDDEDLLTLARSYFNTRQWERVAYVVRNAKGPKAIFLSAYARFTALEKKGVCDSSNAQELSDILLHLEQSKEDPFIFYLRGLILTRLGSSRRAEATASLIRCVKLNPWVWSAWVTLGNCIEDMDELATLHRHLPRHPITYLFSARLSIALHNPTDEDLQAIEALITIFPNSLYLLGQKALIFYHQKDWHQSSVLFSQILKADPCRVDDMDIYSNILHVMENRTSLSKLAHDLLAFDKERPEVCCIVGNHYSLRGAHEKAIKYFKRAVQIDKTCLSAWTLMGHEHVEMKNSEAAIEAYRKAVDLDRRDYRAWFGLGQAYELLGMHRYALNYYQRSSALRPYDVRIWQAMSMCYTDLSRPHEAIACLKRALIATEGGGYGHGDTLIHSKIASLYSALGDEKNSSLWERNIVDIAREAGSPVAEYAKSCLHLANYHISRANVLPHSSTTRQTSRRRPSSSANKQVTLGERQRELNYAREYLRLVAESNAEESLSAGDLLRKLDKLKLESNSTEQENTPQVSKVNDIDSSVMSSSTHTKGA